MEVALRRIFKKAGIVESVNSNLPKGLAWVTFQTAESAQAACNLHPPPSLNNRQLRVQLSRPAASQTAPQADCWFCLGNENFEQRYVVAASLEAYAVLAKGGVTPHHAVIAAVAHLPNWADADEPTQARIQEYIDSLGQVAETAGETVVVFERWLPMRMIEANHMQVNVIPVSKSADFSAAVKELVNKFGGIVNINSISELRRVVGSPARPYLWIKFPEISVLCPGRPPVQLARELVCETLGCTERFNWRDCLVDPETEDLRIEELRSQLNI